MTPDLSGLQPGGGFDNGPVIQAALDYAATHGMVVQMPAGSYHVATGIIIPPAVTLRGAGRWATVIDSQDKDISTVSLSPANDSGCTEGMTILGRNDPSAGCCPLTIPFGANNFLIRDVIAWFGVCALYVAGSDGTFDNCAFGESFGFAAVASNGANWWDRVKIDSTAPYGGPNYVGWFHGATKNDGPVENHFSLCDFSGPYPGGAISINDEFPLSVTSFEGCCFGGDVVINSHHWTGLGSGCEIGGAVTNRSPNPLSATGCFAFAPTVISGAKAVDLSCVNVS